MFNGAKKYIRKIFKQDIISIFKIQIKDIDYLEIIDNHIYYVKRNKLFVIYDCNKININSLEDYSREYKINLYCISIWQLNNKLYCSAKNEENLYNIIDIFNNVVIYTYEYPILEEYLKINKKQGLFLFDSCDKNQSIVLSISVNNKINVILDENVKILSIAYLKPYIYVSIKKYKESIIKIISQIGIFGKIKKISKEVTCGLYYKLMVKNKELLLCQDGPTKIFNLNKKIVFDDSIGSNIGSQVNSYITITNKFRRTYLLFSTWRNTKNYPKSCLYFIRNETKRLVKNYDNIEYSDKLKWSGYKSYRIGKLCFDEKIIFCNKYDYPMVVEFSNYSYKNLINSVVSFCDDKTIIMDDKIKNIENIQTNKYINNFNKNDLTSIKSTNFFITIDTEQHVKNIPFALTGEGLEKQCGVYLIMDILEKYSLKGVFFVNIYEHKNFNGVIERIIKDINDRGHEVGLHYHANSSSKWKNNLIEYSLNEQVDILNYGKNFIFNIIGKYPLSFRGGGYQINMDTFKALEICGFKYDSSAFVSYKQNIIYNSINKITKYNNIIEFPVTTNFLFGYLTKLDLNAQGNANDMLNIMNTHRFNGLENIIVMLHSFSFIKWYKGNDERLKSKLKFTGNRYAIGVNDNLIKEFEIFCKNISDNNEFKNVLFEDLKKEEIEECLVSEKDFVPKNIIEYNNGENICPICENKVSFQEYRNRKNAICPKCRSLERMRFKYLYLKRNLHIDIMKDKNILHIGPAMCVYDKLKLLNQVNYITSDPFSDSMYKYPLENIPFKDNYFDIIICIGILIHVLDDDKCLKEMYRLLSKNGKLILWVGDLYDDKTIERYNRADFDKMKAISFDYPMNLSDGKTILLDDGSIGYNPRYSTRTYGKDFIQKLKNIGYHVDIVNSKDIAGYRKYGLIENDILIIGSKL
ncbi:methyltransferase domain-containing protein [Campylobacter peloridis]|uniref:Methyltransferase domain-containing protein n=1 Tax=Campylobacter peloridis TaxID=488546 RepID=A0ABX6TSY3_9BACT|nr:methyltransferase domain-containing protein [Campylobacter peloridis]AJC84183.1 SAM-dependent methyltransferase [Campylobacter peloridis LMG 23910]QOQ88284.1 methyltransferase domain-containing protein [Campylobacter peloridis]